jgi:hypothetical protein
MNLIDHLMQSGFRLGTDGMWLPQGEVYNGDANDIVRKLGAIEAFVTPLERDALEVQRQEIQTILGEQKVPFIKLHAKPSDPWLPIDLVQKALRAITYRQEAVVYRDASDRLQVEGDNQLSSYLNGVGRRFDKKATYDDYDEAFTAWVINNGLEQVIENAYNSQNTWLQGKFGAYRQLPKNWGGTVAPHAWQFETANRFDVLMRGINALDVGLGKTIASILFLVGLLERGIITRIAIAVPKNVLGKWRDEILLCCPTAAVSLIGAVLKKGEWEDDSSRENLNHQLAQANASRSQFLLMSHTTLARIPMRPETQLAHIESEFEMADYGYYKPENMNSALYDQYTAAKVQIMLERGELNLENLEGLLVELEQLEEDIKTPSHHTKSELLDKKSKRQRLRFITRGASLLGKKRHGLDIFWEDLKIDFLVADEAHKYKGSQAPSGRLNARGLGAGSVSQIATDFLSKARIIQAQNNGKNVLLVSATPIVNSPVELYGMIHMVAPELFLDTIRIHNVDQFLERYAEFGEETVVDDEGNLRIRKYLKRLVNLKELRSIAMRVIHRRTAVHVGLKLPKRNTEFVLLKPTPEQNDLIKRVGIEPLEALRDLMGIVEIPQNLADEKQNVKDELLQRYALVVNHLLRRIELDLEMINPQMYKGFISPKVQAWVDAVASDISAGERVVAFCDVVSMPDPFGDKTNPNGYSFHEKLKRLLLERTNLLESEIAVVNAQTCPDGEDRLRVSKSLKAGLLRVIIGNTETMGEATDLQWGVSRLRSLDVPWNQAKLQQRRGRVERQGNTATEILETYYMGLRGLDPMMMDILGKKADWYNQFWDGEGDHIEANDSNIIPSRAMIEALAIDDEDERQARFDEIKALEQAEREYAEYLYALKVFRKYQLVFYRLKVHEETYGTKRETERTVIATRVEAARRELLGNSVSANWHEQIENPLGYGVFDKRIFQMGDVFETELYRYKHIIRFTKADPIGNDYKAEVLWGVYKTVTIGWATSLQTLTRETLKLAISDGLTQGLWHTAQDKARELALETFMARAAKAGDALFPVWQGDLVEIKLGAEITEQDVPVLPDDTHGVYLYRQWLLANGKRQNPYLGLEDWTHGL